MTHRRYGSSWGRRTQASARSYSRVAPAALVSRADSALAKISVNAIGSSGICIERVFDSNYFSL